MSAPMLGAQKPKASRDERPSAFATPWVDEDGAEDQSRTDDLLITNQLLYQLSYFGLHFKLYRCALIR